MPRLPLTITKYKTQPTPRERKQLLQRKIAGPSALPIFPARQPASAESKPPIRYYELSSDQPAPAKTKLPIRYYELPSLHTRQTDKGFGSRAKHHNTWRNKHALSKGYKVLLAAKAESGHLPTGHLPGKTASFGLYFTFEPHYKQLIDGLRTKFLSRTSTLDSLSPLLGPEFPIFPTVPIEKQEKCQKFLREFCAQMKPFDIDFVPDYHQPQNEITNPRGYYRVGFVATSKNNKHQNLITELFKMLWPGHQNRYSKRRAVILQQDVGFEEQAKRLRNELLSMGVQTFRVQGILLSSRTACDEQGDYKMKREEFSLDGAEEDAAQAAMLSKEILQDDLVEDIGGFQQLGDPHKTLPAISQEPDTGSLAEDLAELWPFPDGEKEEVR